MEKKEYLKQIMIAIIVIAVGLLAINQFLAYRYKVVFLKTPCELCAELNPHFENCINEKRNIKIPIEPISNYNWSNITTFL